jgi:hypothetical protein
LVLNRALLLGVRRVQVLALQPVLVSVQVSSADAAFWANTSVVAWVAEAVRVPLVLRLDLVVRLPLAVVPQLPLLLPIAVATNSKLLRLGA